MEKDKYGNPCSAGITIISLEDIKKLQERKLAWPSYFQARRNGVDTPSEKLIFKKWRLEIIKKYGVSHTKR